MSINCQIPTPSKYAKQLLDSAGYNSNLYGKRILENSCGEGNILCNIVERYINDSFSRGIESEKVKVGLQRDIIAYEIDIEKICVCKKRLDVICLKYGITDVNWAIRHMDYLTSNSESFDYVVGNPPYITYHDMTEMQRDYLRSEFRSCRKGRFDYCYAFIEKSLESLAQKGVLAYLIPYSVLRNQFADNIRSQILPGLTDVYDYGGIPVFEDVVSSSAIIICTNNKEESFYYHMVLSNTERLISKNSLGDKWFFNTTIKGKRRFGDYYEVKNSVATLYNKAFILDNYTMDDEYIYLGNDRIEKALVHMAVSSKSKRKSKKGEMIIFPYEIVDSQVVRIPSEEYFQESYPFTYAYLEKFKASLGKRKLNESVKWYEYGRTQALKTVLGKKLVMSQVVTQKVNLYMCEQSDIPYAGYFIKAKDNANTLDQAKVILESKEFLDYVKSHGTPTTTESYRISVKEILDYMY